MVFGSTLSDRQIHDFMKKWVSVGEQVVRFLACLHGSGYPEQYVLTLCCLPSHIYHGGRKEWASKYTQVISCGECTSDRPLKSGDIVFFRLPDAFSFVHEENAYITYVLILLKVIIDSVT